MQSVFDGHQTADDIASYLDDWQAMAKNKTYPPISSATSTSCCSSSAFATGIWTIPHKPLAWVHWRDSRKSWPTLRTSPAVEDTSRRMVRRHIVVARIETYISTNGCSTTSSITRWMRMKISKGEESFDLDAVSISTIHQSKGLEWPVVFAPCLVEGRFRPSMRGRRNSGCCPNPSSRRTSDKDIKDRKPRSAVCSMSQ